MIKEIRYKNFKSLRDATLPLGRFTLIVGANGTGKSTALKALEFVKGSEGISWKDLISNSAISENADVSLNIKTTFGNETISWEKHNKERIKSSDDVIINDFNHEQIRLKDEELESFKLFSFDSNIIAEPVFVKPSVELEESGRGLVGVLDQLRDSEPEKFEELNCELNRWFIEYDRILFETPKDGVKSFLLRTKFGKHKIKAEDLSDGTRLALAYLTLSYLPNPPKIVAFEEPERRIHPRLLSNIQEAMDRLAYPENFGEKREPIQVIATTHSPYLLDLYKDRQEEIVIADKDENGVHFQNLAQMKNIDKILQGGEALGEVWFTGVLGGVPAHI